MAEDRARQTRVQVQPLEEVVLRQEQHLQRQYGVDFDGQDPNFYWRGVVLRETNYYVWCCSDWNSGHHTRRKAKVENCVAKYSCLGVYYPWVQINAHRNGTFAITSGGT
jgi:hypothetical protein